MWPERACICCVVQRLLQSTLVTRAANAGGGFTTGYEGAVFSSDDPEYKDKTGGDPSCQPLQHRLLLL
jgi:hypothetical protein